MRAGLLALFALERPVGPLAPSYGPSPTRLFGGPSPPPAYIEVPVLMQPQTFVFFSLV